MMISSVIDRGFILRILFLLLFFIMSWKVRCVELSLSISVDSLNIDGISEVNIVIVN